MATKIKIWSDSDPDGDIIIATSLDDAKNEIINDCRSDHSDSDDCDQIVDRCENALNELRDVGDTSEYVDDEYMGAYVCFEVLEI